MKRTAMSAVAGAMLLASAAVAEVIEFDVELAPSYMVYRRVALYGPDRTPATGCAADAAPRDRGIACPWLTRSAAPAPPTYHALCRLATGLDAPTGPLATARRT